jgi:hypothetical protein
VAELDKSVVLATGTWRNAFGDCTRRGDGSSRRYCYTGQMPGRNRRVGTALCAHAREPETPVRDVGWARLDVPTRANRKRLLVSMVQRGIRVGTQPPCPPYEAMVLRVACNQAGHSPNALSMTAERRHDHHLNAAPSPSYRAHTASSPMPVLPRQ